MTAPTRLAFALVPAVLACGAGEHAAPGAGGHTQAASTAGAGGAGGAGGAAPVLPRHVVDVSSGPGYSLALTPRGRIFCWGYNGYRDCGPTPSVVPQ